MTKSADTEANPIVTTTSEATSKLVEVSLSSGKDISTPSTALSETLHTGQSSNACGSTNRISATSSPASEPTSDSGSSPLCIAQKAPRIGGKVDPEEQARLASIFCQEERDPLSSKNPSFLKQYWNGANTYFYSLYWTGGDMGCSYTEKIDRTLCAETMKKNYLACNNDGAGGFTERQCVIYEFRHFEAEPEPGLYSVNGLGYGVETNTSIDNPTFTYNWQGVKIDQSRMHQGRKILLRMITHEVAILLRNAAVAWKATATHAPPPFR
ncbi:hypothetical protein HRG_013267 [Hirsutella rhossiliensis]